MGSNATHSLCRRFRFAPNFRHNNPASRQRNDNMGNRDKSVAAVGGVFILAIVFFLGRPCSTDRGTFS